MARDRMNRPLLFRDRILKCCVRISPRILTTDPHHRPPLPSPHTGSQPQPCVQSNSAWQVYLRTINGCSCAAWSRGDSDRTRPSALYYGICSLCSAGQLAECGAWVNDPRQSVSANFRGQVVRISPRISRILADLRPPSSVRTFLLQTAVVVGAVRQVARRHGDN